MSSFGAAAKGPPLELRGALDCQPVVSWFMPEKAMKMLNNMAYAAAPGVMRGHRTVERTATPASSHRPSREGADGEPQAGEAEENER